MSRGRVDIVAHFYQDVSDSLSLAQTRELIEKLQAQVRYHATRDAVTRALRKCDGCALDSALDRDRVADTVTAELLTGFE